MIKLLLIVAYGLLSIGCYNNYQGWEKCQKNCDRIADDLYQRDKDMQAMRHDYVMSELNVMHLQNKLDKMGVKK